MGCTASKPLTIVARNPEDLSPSPSSSSSSSSSSASHLSNSSSSPSKVPKRALSLPMPLVHHPPTKKGDTHHLVSLTSTSYGSLLLIHPKDSNFNSNGSDSDPPQPPQNLTNNNTVNQTQPEPEQSLSPDSVINTWELMDGLNDDDDEKSNNFDAPMIVSKKSSSCRYTTLDGLSPKKLLDPFEALKPSETVKEENFSPSSLDKKPLWQHLSEEALLAKLDPNVALSYRRALSSRQLGSSRRSLRSMGSTITTTPLSSCSSLSDNLCCLPVCAEDRIVVYFTSLRGIRKTYEDCCLVRMILKGFRVVVDEKDISMDLSYRKELQNALGVGKAVTLPQVFIRGKHVGNAEEIKLMNESGELANLLKGFPIRDPVFVCESCGDARFVPCPNCNGSRKVFEEEQGGLRRCPDCNENGLIRCPCCCCFS